MLYFYLPFVCQFIPSPILRVESDARSCLYHIDHVFYTGSFSFIMLKKSDDIFRKASLSVVILKFAGTVDLLNVNASYNLRPFFSAIEFPYISLIIFCSSVASSMHERYDELPTTVAVTFTMSNSQSLSRRTKLMKGDNHSFADGSYRPSSIDGR